MVKYLWKKVGLELKFINSRIQNFFRLLLYLSGIIYRKCFEWIDECKFVIQKMFDVVMIKT